MSAAAYTLVRYLVAGAAAALAQHGWTIANADGATLDAVTQLVLGAVGFAVPAAIGVMTSSVRWMLARLQRHHAPALVVAATQVVTEQPALATRNVTVP